MWCDQNNLRSNNEGIKKFRENIFSGKNEQFKNLENWSNFYTISECRDLCFHAQEHRFTIKQINETMKSTELKFLGFLLEQPVKSLYEKYYPEDIAQTNLQNWAIFEEKHPNTFRGMYQFWACKTKTWILEEQIYILILSRKAPFYNFEKENKRVFGKV